MFLEYLCVPLSLVREGICAYILDIYLPLCDAFMMLHAVKCFANTWLSCFFFYDWMCVHKTHFLLEKSVRKSEQLFLRQKGRVHAARQPWWTYVCVFILIVKGKWGALRISREADFPLKHIQQHLCLQMSLALENSHFGSGDTAVAQNIDFSFGISFRDEWWAKHHQYLTLNILFKKIPSLIRH